MTRRSLTRLALATGAIAASARDALAHPGRAIEPHDAWSAWSWEPLVVLTLALSAALYTRGVRTLWARAGRGRGVSTRAVAAFALGWTALAIALVSPVHAMGAALFSAHMAQHELLVALAAPLLVLGAPLVAALWALPKRWRRAAGDVARTTWLRRALSVLTRPFVATVVHAIALWAWHAPALYDASVRSELVHTLQHASFLGTGVLFWWVLLSHGARRRHAGASVFYLFLTAMHTGALGAILTVAPRPWYTAYLATTGPWGLTPLEDQQLAGLVMWIPAGASYVVAALWLFAGWLGEAGRRASTRDAAHGVAPGAARTDVASASLTG